MMSLVVQDESTHYASCPSSQVSYPRKPRGDMKTHLDRPLVVNPQDNRNNNTNKTQPGELPLDQEYRRQDVDHRLRATHHYHYHHHQRRANAPDGGEAGRPAETRIERGFSCTSLGNVEGQQGEERHVHRNHRSHRHKNREGRDARSASPHRSAGAEGNHEHRRSRQHRREGEEGRRHRSKGTEGEGEKGEEGEGRKARRHRHGNQERSRGHRTRR